ncbi:hypothetical protein O3G_MSEX010196 [Manduca sexta]|uniref:Uncharacterized protein n=1 Tax=Manduca sexta TaxID=7130 RepID=A0A921ZGI1_MANSE|nr:hypothetical protein O3G_MSEX010196 [Manduca sexta]KAG6457246.1 hypothetical protein O3G_MSEX010196 [Manduca sexta]
MRLSPSGPPPRTPRCVARSGCSVFRQNRRLRSRPIGSGSPSSWARRRAPTGRRECVATGTTRSPTPSGRAADTDDRLPPVAALTTSVRARRCTGSTRYATQPNAVALRPNDESTILRTAILNTHNYSPITGSTTMCRRHQSRWPRAGRIVLHVKNLRRQRHKRRRRRRRFPRLRRRPRRCQCRCRSACWWRHTAAQVASRTHGACARLRRRHHARPSRAPPRPPRPPRNCFIDNKLLRRDI